MKNRKSTIVIACLVVFVVVIIGVVSLTSQKEILCIGEMKTSKEEVGFSVEDVKGMVKNKLVLEYKKDATEFKWEDTFGEKTGYEYIKEEVLSHLKYIKVQQQESIKAQIIKKFDYTYFLEMLEKENKQRQVAISNGQPVFGPEQYSEKQYYNYFNNNIRMQLKKYLIENGKLSISDEEIENYYEENKEYFLNENFMEVKENVTSFGQDVKYQEYIDSFVASVNVEYDENKILKVIKNQVR